MKEKSDEELRRMLNWGAEKEVVIEVVDDNEAVTENGEKVAFFKSNELRHFKIVSGESYEIQYRDEGFTKITGEELREIVITQIEKI